MGVERRSFGRGGAERNTNNQRPVSKILSQHPILTESQYDKHFVCGFSLFVFCCFTFRLHSVMLEDEERNQTLEAPLHIKKRRVIQR